MAGVTQACGVPPEAILLEAQSRTTVENLSFAVSLLARQNLLDTIRTVHLVSCPWHMRCVLHLATVAFIGGQKSNARQMNGFLRESEGSSVHYFSDLL